MNEFINDPAPDPRLREALGSLDRPPVEDVDWSRLQAAVAARAELPLARRRASKRRMPRMRIVAPAAAAAGLALVVAMQGLLPERGAGDLANGEVPEAFHPVVEQVLGTEISELELDLLFGDVSADMLVVAAME